MKQEITPDGLFESILSANGIKGDEVDSEDNDVISISRDHLLLIAFAGMNATLNILIEKGVITKSDMENYISGSVRAITENFDFGFNKKE